MPAGTSPSPVSFRRTAHGAALLTALSLFVGCAASPPTTTYIDADGREVTVDWSDYPADASTDAEDVLGRPTVEDVPARWTELRAALTRSIDVVLAGHGVDLAWESAGEDGWFPYGGNGYGGDSMLRVYNSATWQAEAAIPHELWEVVVDAAERELADRGIARRTVTAAEEDSGLSTWMHDADFFDGGEFLTVSVQDARLDDEALADAEQFGHLVSGITLFYGIQTIREADRAEFEARAAPFDALDRPQATHSD